MKLLKNLSPLPRVLFSPSPAGLSFKYDSERQLWHCTATCCSLNSLTHCYALLLEVFYWLKFFYWCFDVVTAIRSWHDVRFRVAVSCVLRATGSTTMETATSAFPRKSDSSRWREGCDAGTPPTTSKTNELTFQRWAKTIGLKIFLLRFAADVLYQRVRP